MATPTQTPTIRVAEERVSAILAKIRALKTEAFSDAERQLLIGIIETWAHLNELVLSGADIAAIRRCFGHKRTPRAKDDEYGTPSEPPADDKADINVVQADDEQCSAEVIRDTATTIDTPTSNTPLPDKPRRRDNHGRRRDDAMAAVERQHHTHIELQTGDTCPCCARGRLYKFRPREFTTISGRAPLVATRHTVDVLACNRCKVTYAAPLPQVLDDDGVSGVTLYSFSAVAVSSVFRFFGGSPMHRQQNLQKAMGVHVSDAAIWDMCERQANAAAPIFRHLVSLIARVPVLYGDDTGAKILTLRKVTRANRAGKVAERTGCHTTCVIGQTDDHRLITLFRTGIHHTGEVLDVLVAERPTELAPPVFMADCAASNTITTTSVLYAGCNAHAVRRFKALIERYPEHAEYALTRYRTIYDHEAHCVREGLSAEARRDYHAQHSKPLLTEISERGHALIEQRKIEPNSDVAASFAFVSNNAWRLSAFTRHPGAPLDNNRCERALRICVRLRETGHFFRNTIGSNVADCVLTVGATALECGVNLIDYFVAMQRHHRDVREHPEEWVPWRYAARLEALRTRAPPGDPPLANTG